MEPNSEVLATLQAKAKQQSIDELKAKGKTKVKVIRAKDIAALIQEAVQRAIQDSSLLNPAQVEELVHKSKVEFQDLQQRWREREQAERERDAQIDRLRQENTALMQQLAAFQGSPAASGTAPAGAAAPAAAPAGIDQNTLMLQMMQQLMEIKSQATAPAPAGADSEAALASRLDALVGSLDKKLESFGKKIGVTSAVDSDVDMTTLFEKGYDVELESNMDDVKVKTKKGGGIGANLERMKRLRGDG